MIEWEEEREYIGVKIVRINIESCVRCGICYECCFYGCIYIDDEGNYVVNEFICEGCNVCGLVCLVVGIIIFEEVCLGVIRKVIIKYGFLFILV